MARAAWRKKPSARHRRSGSRLFPHDDSVSIPAPSPYRTSWLATLKALSSARRDTKRSRHHAASPLSDTSRKALKTLSSVRWSPCEAPSFRLAAAACSCLARGLTKIASTLIMPASASASRAQPCAPERNTILAAMGSSGSAAICSPSGRVSSPLSSSAPSAYSCSSARSSALRGGAAMNSKPATSLMPIALSCSTIDARWQRRISGGAVAFSWSKARSVYRRKHLPGASRPARPARCRAAAFETGVTTSASTPVRALKARALQSPVSTT
mmetsp:Transcript_7197/g.29358  ORF Transcript_7197/g.29358 Transcript_7197/m.29358 type:complete len:270 (-) Transcript_7197:961-1770(-)